MAIELKAVARPVTADECRALADHLFKLADAAGQAQAFEKLKTLSPDGLRACISATSRTQFTCVMSAAELSAALACK